MTCVAGLVGICVLLFMDLSLIIRASRVLCFRQCWVLCFVFIYPDDKGESGRMGRVTFAIHKHTISVEAQQCELVKNKKTVEKQHLTNHPKLFWIRIDYLCCYGVVISLFAELVFLWTCRRIKKIKRWIKWRYKINITKRSPQLSPVKMALAQHGRSRMDSTPDT